MSGVVRAAIVALLACGAVTVVRSLLGVEVIGAGSAGTTPRFAYEPWEETLRLHVDEAGRVDYSALARDDVALRRFCAGLARTGPRTAPSLFPTEPERLAYYVNAYNALTMMAVVRKWPIDSVFDVHGPVSPKDGFGFFWGLRFQLDGGGINLYALEHRILRREFPDARIHAAINCASASCPRLADEAYLPGRLDEQLDGAARRFTSPPHVVIDDEEGAIVLSAIYDWFSVDFEAHAAALDVGVTVLDWIEAHAADDVRTDLRRAREVGYPVRYAEYDWTVNAAPR